LQYNIFGEIFGEIKKYPHPSLSLSPVFMGLAAMQRERWRSKT